MMNRHSLVLTLCAALGVNTGCAAQDSRTSPASNEASPYVNEQGRTIKALSAERIQGLLAGEGLRYALPAELNSYPGPRHVLDLSDSLSLTTEQAGAVESEFQRMRKAAVEAGRELIAVEQRLDSLFATGSASEQAVRDLTHEAAEYEARVRSAHLLAHVRTTEILTEAQVQKYERLRGYSTEMRGEHRMGTQSEARHVHGEAPHVQGEAPNPKEEAPANEDRHAHDH